jgi:hypothetical protein
MSHIVKTREVRPTAHQQRMRDFKESAYQTLRKYQRGEFASSFGGIAVGQLDVALTKVLDDIADAADQVFPHRSGGKDRTKVKNAAD